MNRTANYILGLFCLAGLVGAMCSLNNGITDLIGRVCGEPAQVVAMAGIAVAGCLNGLMAGNFLSRAAFGGNDEQ